MRWSLDARAEILGRGDQPLAKIGLPDPIHDDSRGGGIAFVHNPPGQPEAVSWRVCRERVQHRGYSRLDFFTRPQSVAALQEVGHTRLLALVQDQRRWRIGPVGPQIGDLLVQVSASRIEPAKNAEQLPLLFRRPLLGSNGQ